MAFVKLNREIAYNGVFEDNDLLLVYVRLVLGAKYASTVENGVVLDRGQLIISVRKFAEKNGLSYQRTRTVLKTLEQTRFISITGYKSFSIITVINYDCGNDFPAPSTQLAAQEQRTVQRGSNAASLLNKKIKNLSKQEVRAQQQKNSDPELRAALADEFGEQNVVDYEQRFELWRARQTRPVVVGMYELIGRWMRDDHVVKPREPSFSTESIMDSIIAGYSGN